VTAAEIRAAHAWVANNITTPISLVLSVSKHLIESMTGIYAARFHRLATRPRWKGLAARRTSRDYGFIDSGKYLEGAQTLTVKLLQPRIRSSRMIRI
jgi:hypothetical protein